MSKKSEQVSEAQELWSIARFPVFFIGGLVVAAVVFLYLMPMALNWHRPLPDGWKMEYNSATKTYRYILGDGWHGWSEHSTKWGCTAAAWSEARSLIRESEKDKHWREVVPSHVVTNCQVIQVTSTNQMPDPLFEVVDKEISDLEKRVTALEMKGNLNIHLQASTNYFCPNLTNSETLITNILSQYTNSWINSWIDLTGTGIKTRMVPVEIDGQIWNLIELAPYDE